MQAVRQSGKTPTHQPTYAPPGLPRNNDRTTCRLNRPSLPRRSATSSAARRRWLPPTSPASTPCRKIEALTCGLNFFQASEVFAEARRKESKEHKKQGPPLPAKEEGMQGFRHHANVILR